MTQAAQSVLLIGYGNPGRMDDGLGPALVERLEERDIPGLTLDSDYQLTVEDAHAVARHDIVIFADADVSGPEPYSFRKLCPAGSSGFSTHAVEPAEVLALARELFGARAKAFVLGIRGYDFNAFGERLSARAERNLAVAADAVERIIREGAYEGAADADATDSEAGPYVDLAVSRAALN